MDGIAVICTNDSEAWGEIQPTGLNLSVLNPNAGLAVGYMMAYLASALIAGKGSSQLKKSILQEYTMHKAEAIPMSCFTGFCLTFVLATALS